MGVYKVLFGLASLTLLIVSGVHYFCESRKTAYPIDEHGNKIRLGGIPWDFKNCGTESDPLVITSLVFSSMPERAAPPNDVTLTGTLMIHNDMKTLNVIVKLSGVQVFNNNLSINGTYDPGDMFSFPYSFQIPGIAPSGSYTLDLKFINKQGQQISCTQVSMAL